MRFLCILLERHRLENLIRKKSWSWLITVDLVHNLWIEAIHVFLIFVKVFFWHRWDHIIRLKVVSSLAHIHLVVDTLLLNGLEDLRFYAVDWILFESLTMLLLFKREVSECLCSDYILFFICETRFGSLIKGRPHGIESVFIFFVFDHGGLNIITHLSFPILDFRFLKLKGWHIKTWKNKF